MGRVELSNALKVSLQAANRQSFAAPFPDSAGKSDLSVLSGERLAIALA
jgi:hypothetical protein